MLGFDLIRYLNFVCSINLDKFPYKILFFFLPFFSYIVYSRVSRDFLRPKFKLNIWGLLHKQDIHFLG